MTLGRGNRRVVGCLAFVVAIAGCGSRTSFTPTASDLDGHASDSSSQMTTSSTAAPEGPVSPSDQPSNVAAPGTPETQPPASAAEEVAPAFTRPAVGAYYYRAPRGTPPWESGYWSVVEHRDDPSLVSIDEEGVIRELAFGGGEIRELAWTLNGTEPEECRWSSPLRTPLGDGLEASTVASCIYDRIKFTVRETASVKGSESIVLKGGVELSGTLIHRQRTQEVTPPSGPRFVEVTDSDELFSLEYGLVLRTTERVREVEPDPSPERVTTFQIDTVVPETGPAVEWVKPNDDIRRRSRVIFQAERRWDYARRVRGSPTWSRMTGSRLG